MVASCYRRLGDYSTAQQLYEKIHSENPDNIECLRYLVTICKETGQRYENYQIELRKLEKEQEDYAGTPGAFQQVQQQGIR